MVSCVARWTPIVSHRHIRRLHDTLGHATAKNPGEAAKISVSHPSGKPVLLHPNRLATAITDRSTRGHHHARRRQNHTCHPIDVLSMDWYGGHPSYCLPIRPPQTKFAGRDYDAELRAPEPSWLKDRFIAGYSPVSPSSHTLPNRFHAEIPAAVSTPKTVN
jgi:hypothetical protein